ncbi:F-box protein [Iris pallida]|uniref:F-box protein n=1 Tax=Iris pallida TaxID=29817 RepID=A0AAX6FA49_IRIPA|nr:F-box protein [Iris pallida]
MEKPSSSATATAAAGVSSPLSSSDTLRSILQLLQPADLARAACVCREWRAVASEREMREGAFRKPWRVRRVLGEPSSPAFWRSPDRGRFAISHRLRCGDSLASLALSYSVQMIDIRRLNNMMSDHGIYLRERLLIPISSSKPDVLFNSTCYIELDAHAKREVAVLYLDDSHRPQGYSKNDHKAEVASSATAAGRGGRRRFLVESMKRSMQVDDGTAEYYLSASNGDLRAAMQRLNEDLSWEQQRTALR